MSCPIPKIPTDASADSVLPSHRTVHSAIGLLAVVALIDLIAVAGLSLLGNGVSLPAILLHALLVAAASAVFLWRYAITPYRDSLRAAVKKSRAVLDAAPEGIFEISAGGRILSLNAQAIRLFGYSREELLNQEIEILLPPRIREGHVQKRESFIASQGIRAMGSGYELFGQHKLGHEIPVEVSLSTVSGGGQPLVICIVRDISEQKAIKNAIVQANENLNSGLQSHKELLESLHKLNEFSELLQCCMSLQESYPLIAAACARLFPERSGAIFLMKASRNAIERVTGWGDHRSPNPVIAPQECWALRRGNRHDNRSTLCNACGAGWDPSTEAGSICVPMIGQGDTIGVLHISHPPAATPGSSDFSIVAAVAERIAIAFANLRMREALRDQAIRDDLTGLVNRRFLEEYLELELLRARQGRYPLSILMLDVDFFKKFNDTFGHKAGDMVLREIARVLRQETRNSDVACRYGGEELVVVLPDTPLSAGVSRAGQIRQAVEKLSVVIEGQSLGIVTISIGVASTRDYGYEAAAILHAADEALYAAKKAGRNRVVPAPSPDGPGIQELSEQKPVSKSVRA